MHWIQLRVRSYLRSIVSRYSPMILWRSSWNSPMRSFSFFLKVLVMEMRVRSVGVPASHPGLLRLERLALSRSSSLVLMLLATLLTCHQNHVLELRTNRLRHLSFRRGLCAEMDVCGYRARIFSSDWDLWGVLLNSVQALSMQITLPKLNGENAHGIMVRESWQLGSPRKCWEEHE